MASFHPAMSWTKILLIAAVIFATGVSSAQTGGGDPPLWSALYRGGGPDGYLDAAQLADGSWVLGGWISGPYTRITRVVADGQVVWDKTLGIGTPLLPEQIRQIEATPDGGFAMTMDFGFYYPLGLVETDGVFAKFDSGGNLLWLRRIGTVGIDDNWHFTQTIDNGYCVAGVIDSADMVVLKFDSEGQLLWQTGIGGGPSNINLTVTGVGKTDGGGCIAVGSASVQGSGNIDGFAASLDGDGAVNWQRTYGGPGDFAYDHFLGLDASADGGVVVVGSTATFGDWGTNLWLLELTASGDIQWQAAVTPPAHGDDWGWAVSKLADGYLVAGNTQIGLQRFPWIFRLANAGTMVWEWVVGDHLDVLYGISVGQDGTFLAIGFKDFGGRDPAWAMQALTSTGLVDDTCAAVTASSVVDTTGDGIVVTDTTLPVGAGGVAVIEESNPGIGTVDSWRTLECSNGVTIGVFFDGFESGDATAWDVSVP